MKKSLTFLFLTILIFQSTFSQKKSDKVEIKWGPEIKESKTATLNNIIGHDESGVYVLKYDRKGKINNFIEHFDKNMVKTHSQGINLEYNKNDYGLKYIIHFNEKLFLFTDYYDKKTDQNSLYVQEIDKKSLSPRGKRTRIASFRFEGRKKMLSNDFSLRISRDDSKILIYSTIPTKEKDDNERFDVTVLDGDMNKLWEKTIISPYKSDLYSTSNIKVDNDGNIHILGLLYKEKDERVRKEVNHNFQIMSYYENGTRLKKYSIEIEGKFLTDMQITIDDDKNIVCAGFYSKKGLYSIDGSYYLKLDTESEQIVNRSFEEFSLDFITQNMTEKEEKKTKKKDAKGKDAELYRYELDEIILREDGGAVLVGEQYYVVVNTYTDANGNTRTTYTYHYNDIIVINVDPEGNIEWTEKIAKKQITSNDNGYFSSYTLAVVDDKLYFVFNDHPKNLFYNGSGKVYNMKRGKESLVVLVSMDMNGAQEREALFTKGETEIWTRPKVCDQISEDEMILFGENKKTHRFARLRFKGN